MFPSREENNIKIKYRYFLKINCLGVRLGVRSNNLSLFKEVKENLAEILPVSQDEITDGKVEHWISIVKGEENKKEFTVYKDEEFTARNFSKEIIYDLIVSKIRATVAEFASDYVFLHAGAVSCEGKAIIIPGKSRMGKTTLVTELIKRGCEYLSDEFAVIDKKGLVHPFAKKLSVRGIIDEHRQIDVDIERYGAVAGKKPVPIGFVLVAEYKLSKRKIKPAIKINTSGAGVMSAVSNSISVRRNPKFVLEVLSNVVNQAVVLEASRGEAAEFAEFLLNFLREIKRSQEAFA